MNSFAIISYIAILLFASGCNLGNQNALAEKDIFPPDDSSMEGTIPEEVPESTSH